MFDAIPSTGLPALSACCTVRLPPLHTTRSARRAASIPGRYEATRARVRTGGVNAAPAVATRAATPSSSSAATIAPSSVGSPELPIVT